ncbi:TPA: hypothetical protein I8W54_004215 [Morganella morganii]|nr:hypothetical protein [Morganella morganii]
MTPSTLPNRLWRALNEVKNYVGKMPDGVTLTDIRDKVSAYGELKNGDRALLVKHIEERCLLLVLKAKKPKAVKVTTFLRHKKYGYPSEIPGYEYPLGRDAKSKKCGKCHEEKTPDEFHINNSRKDGRQAYCKECDSLNSQTRDWTATDNYGKKKSDLPEPDNSNGEIMKPVKTPEQMRQEAEELIRAAEQAEKNQATEQWKLEFKSKFEQQKLEVMQAVGMANRKFDEMMDAMAQLAKAGEKLKELKVE